MLKKEEKRKVPFKNYIILLVICLVTIFLAFSIRNRYVSYQEYQLTIPVLKDKVYEVSTEELDSYLIAHPDAILYVQVNSDENSREVGKKLYKSLKKRNIVEESVYVDLSKVDKDNFYKSFNKKYGNDKYNLNNYPAVILFSEGKIREIVSKEKKNKLTIDQIEQLFDEYEVDNTND